MKSKLLLSSIDPPKQRRRARFRSQDKSDPLTDILGMEEGGMSMGGVLSSLYKKQESEKGKDGIRIGRRSNYRSRKHKSMSVTFRAWKLFTHLSLSKKREGLERCEEIVMRRRLEDVFGRWEEETRRTFQSHLQIKQVRPTTIQFNQMQ